MHGAHYVTGAQLGYPAVFEGFPDPQQMQTAAKQTGEAHVGWRHREAVVILQQVHSPVSKLLRIHILVPQAGRVLGARLKPRVAVDAQLEPWSSSNTHLHAWPRSHQAT